MANWWNETKEVIKEAPVKTKESIQNWWSVQERFNEFDANQNNTASETLVVEDVPKSPSNVIPSEVNWQDNAEIKTILSKNPIISRIIQTESSGDPLARNKDTGARGLMQIMKGTAELETGFGVDYNLSYDELDDPVKNVKYGSTYFLGLKKAFGSNRDALIAYNWGSGKYKEWKAAGADESKLPKETRDYLKKILK